MTAATERSTVKQPAIAAKGMVTSNHPLASLAGTRAAELPSEWEAEDATGAFSAGECR